MDLDGDGVLSMYELEYFYTEQISKMDVLGIETMLFEDCLCQVCRLLIKINYVVGLESICSYWVSFEQIPFSETQGLWLLLSPLPPSFFPRLEIDSQPVGLQERAILSK